LSKGKATVTLKENNDFHWFHYQKGIMNSSVRRLCGPALLFVFLFSTPSQARDLQGRLGLGYNDEFANSSQTNGVPGISLKYGMSRDLDVEAIAGVSTSSPTNSVAALKFDRNLFYETNLNFYFFAGGGEVGANEKTGFEVLSGFGAEFFIPGIESLGFAMDIGGDLDNLSGSFALKTIGVSFINAGIHFYF
jgi:hypothetical protein